MITVLETTKWEGIGRNHKYILSDDRQWLYGYIRDDQKYPDLFTKPMRFDVRGRQFKVLVQTSEQTEGKSWRVKGSKGAVHTVTNEPEWKCTCTGFKYRGECKHVSYVQSKAA